MAAYCAFLGVAAVFPAPELGAGGRRFEAEAAAVAVALAGLALRASAFLEAVSVKGVGSEAIPPGKSA